MLAYPPMDKLLEKTGDEYTLVIQAARRGRKLNQGEEPVVECKTSKPVSNALEEILAGKLQYIPVEKQKE
ncbi:MULTISPECIES: DNA-directed RNA polymerase subunit omega [unclassified Candidatus Frackibacter]|uniref:DNA-directed RNA polymerase subunit omega n=1 Tax=unclassified Candidatus Frackibacter TaxID=2648818 RepID=UPI0008924D11|nr:MULTISPECIES: DNA-directed RNA polymerase subunit omega [unclassified Candidatus Frackibacter]SDC57922.1 DNA-directed RNA polymerase subunit omega [Candidatus Frackibacter sp. WG11]SEM72022.1 DNA-directed RNA polymerase subunit omega [Candidatus Frackibacter sp. WG12]SFL82267.1 DNA-directed RNA polymerase subunit omega [Candidatus Frackibacter sp. WG13]